MLTAKEARLQTDQANKQGTRQAIISLSISIEVRASEGRNCAYFGIGGLSSRTQKEVIAHLEKNGYTVKLQPTMRRYQVSW